MLIDLTENPTCTECGLCREVCPVFQIQRQEEYSPRGRAMLDSAGLQTWSFINAPYAGPAGSSARLGMIRVVRSLRAGLISGWHRNASQSDDDHQYPAIRQSLWTTRRRRVA